MGDGFYRSKDPTNSIKVLKEKAVKEKEPKNTKKTLILVKIPATDVHRTCQQRYYEDTMSNTSR